MVGGVVGVEDEGTRMMTKQTVKWEDPPPKKVKGGELWATRLTPLMERPGEWANLGEHSAASAGNLRGAVKGNRRYVLPEGQWEFTCRSNGKPGRATLYARYLGPKAKVRKKSGG